MINEPTLKASDTQKVSHPTEEKIKKLRQLRPGWFYGSGVQIDERTIWAALELNAAAIAALLYETDVFPAESGELMVTVYYGDYHLELTIEKDGAISTMLERGDCELESLEDLSLDLAKAELLNFRELAWKQSDYSQKNNGIEGSADSPASRSKIQAITPVSRSSTGSARSRVAALFAITSSDTMSRPQDTRQSSGVSGRPYFQMASN